MIRALRTLYRLRHHGSPAGPTRDERGASLVIALVFIGALSFMLIAVLEYGYTGQRVATATKNRNATYYQIDGAIEFAAAALRADVELGRYGSVCPTRTMNLSNGSVATVTCAPEPGSGAIEASPGKQLKYAIIAANPKTGVDAVSLTGTKTNLRVRGGVLANTAGGAANSISVEGSSQIDASAAAVVASGTCSGSIVGIAGAPACPASSYPSFYAGAIRPFTLAQPDLAGLPARSAPACPTSAPHYVALEPGRYTDAAALSALTNGACPDAVVHLLPGIFHLSFTGGGTWLVNDRTVSVIAGQPNGWTVPSAGDPRPDLESPSRLCRTDVDSAPNEGAMLAFDATARLEVRVSGRSELCGYGAVWNNQRVSMYQAEATSLAQITQPMLIVGASSGSSALTVRGTVFAVKAPARVFLRDNVQVMFERGLYVGSLELPGYTSANRTHTSTPFTLAGCSTSYSDRTVVLEVTIDGVRRARAVVRFDDDGGLSPGVTSTVLGWRQY